MFKTIDAGSWPKLESQGIASFIPHNGDRFTQNDRSLFFRKTAASEQFLNEIGEIKLGNGDIPIHVNAIGSTEHYGPNRKFDAFNEDTCRKYHHTFKTAKFYAHHKNKNPEISYGKVASATYNEPMHRVELLIIGNGTKEAAARNGGLVMPDEFLNSIEKNASIAVSMGCGVKGDVCSRCHNFARHRGEYCNEITCRDKKTGEYFPGCKEGLGKIASDGRVVYVENIEPNFFDISGVGIPADRSAYGFRATYLENKTASIDATPEQYLNLTDDKFNAAAYGRMRTVLSKLAAIEHDTYTRDINYNSEAYGIRSKIQDPSLGTIISNLTKRHKYASLVKLANNGVLLSPENFITAFNLPEESINDILYGSGAIYRDLYSRCNNRKEASLSNAYMAMSNCGRLSFVDTLLSADQIKRGAYTHIDGRSIVNGIYNLENNTKTAGCTNLYPEVAEAYAIYKIAALCHFPDIDRAFGEKVAVWQTFSP